MHLFFIALAVVAVGLAIVFFAPKISAFLGKEKSAVEADASADLTKAKTDVQETVKHL